MAVTGQAWLSTTAVTNPVVTLLLTMMLTDVTHTEQRIITNLTPQDAHSPSNKRPRAASDSRVKDLKAGEVVRRVAEEVQQGVARRGLHLRHRLVAPHLWDDEATVGGGETGCTLLNMTRHHPRQGEPTAVQQRSA